MRSVAALVLAATLAALTGCSAPAEPAPSASPSATSTPVFASEEEALAAAEKAYTEYLSVLDTVLNNGGKGADALAGVSEGAALEEALQGADEFREKELRSVGTRNISGASLQSFDSDGVDFYVCENIAGVDLLDAGGRSLVSSDRPETTPFEARMSITSDGHRISERALWTGDGVCDE